MIKHCLVKILLPALVLALLVVPLNAAFAAYEPTVQPNPYTGFNPVKGPAEDLVIQWTEPTTSGTDSIMSYVYKWTTSAAAPTLDQNNNDGAVVKEENSLTTPKSFFANDDDDVFRYLHIRTVYLVLGEGENLSNNVAVGPFNFDNVKPDGTAVLKTDVSGQTATTSTVNPVTLTVTVASAYSAKVYMANTSTRPATAKASFEGATTVTHTVEGTGSKTIYYWLEDAAGNISDPKTLTFTMIAGKSMDPAGAIQIASGDEQIFTIQGRGDTETFKWVFESPSPADVASFVGYTAGDDAAQVTVKGEKEGTFKVRATSNLDASVYTSGTVTVTLAGIKGDVNNDSVVDITDVLLVIDIIFGVQQPTDYEFWAANVVDSDNVIDITDLLAIIDIIFGT